MIGAVAHGGSPFLGEIWRDGGTWAGAGHYVPTHRKRKSSPSPGSPSRPRVRALKALTPRARPGGQAALGPQGQKPQTQGGAGQELQQPAQGPSEDHQEQDAENRMVSQAASAKRDS